MTVNLKLLSVFVTVAQHNSFRLAAKELDRSQSGISTQVRQLEDQLGVTLFHRTTRRVTLSTEGERLLTHVRKALTEIDDGIAATFEAEEQRRGRVVLACATIAGCRLASVLSAFRREFPDVAVHVREVHTKDMLEFIKAQEVDFGIGPHVKGEGEFNFKVVLADEICAIVPKSHPLAGANEVSLSELRQTSMVYVTDSAARVLGEQRSEREHIRVDSTYEGTQVQTTLSVVEAGLGAAVLPRFVLPSKATSAYIALPLKPPVRCDVCIVTLAGKVLSSLANEFVAVTERVLRGTYVNPHSPDESRNHFNRQATLL